MEKEIELEEGQIIDMNGEVQWEDDCVTLHSGDICHMDETIYCEDDSEYYSNTDYDNHDVDWCHHYEAYYFTSNMVWGEIYDGGEGFFHVDSDYAYSERDDRYFQCSSTAERNHYYWCDSQEDYVHEDDLDNGSEWDNTYSILDKRHFKTFGLPYTFGVEMETCDGFLDYNSRLSLKAVHDGSIEAKEYVTGVLQGDKGMNMLERICESINEKCHVDKTCGVHVHIGGANFNRRFSILSIMLGQIMQSQLFRIQPISRRSNTYCKEIPEKYHELRTVNKRLYPYTYKRMLRLLSEYVYNNDSEFDKTNCKKVRHPNGHYASTRYKWLNLNNCSYSDGPETIEFRQHSGSLDYHKIRRWVLFCMSYVSFVENHSRTIIEAYNKFQENPVIMSATDQCISMRDVLCAGLGEFEGHDIANYYDRREERFN